MAMAVEEMIQAQPMDAVVLMGGCDKTVPASDGSSLSWKTCCDVGSRSDDNSARRSVWVSLRIAVVLGSISLVHFKKKLTGLRKSGSHVGNLCEGTISMAVIAETLGVMLPNTASIPLFMQTD